MHRKLTRKEKIKAQNESIQPIVIRQGKFVKRSSYLLLIIAFFCAITVLPNFKLPDTGIDEVYIIVLILTMIFIIWMFVILPIQLITTTIIITIEDKQFKLESNRKKYSINSNFDKLIWWRKINTDYGDGLQLKFESKKVSLTNIEFIGLFELEKFLRRLHNNKEKVSR